MSSFGYINAQATTTLPTTDISQEDLRVLHTTDHKT